MQANFLSFFIALLLFFPFGLKAQIKEINPNVQWTYVKNQKLTAQDGQLYQFEFPIEKGYDYVVNLNHGLKGAQINLRILDLQMKPVVENYTERSDDSFMYEFDVPHNHTYMIYYLISRTDNSAEPIDLELNIVRRLKT